MLLQELAAPFYSNSSVLSSDLQLLSKKNAFNDMLTVGMLRSQPDVYLIHRCVVQRKTLLSLLVFFCSSVNKHNRKLDLQSFLDNLSMSVKSFIRLVANFSQNDRGQR